MGNSASGLGTVTAAPLRVGGHALSSPVLLAPMSGITDLPFRRAVSALGVGFVVCEMVASELLVRDLDGARRRVRGCDLSPFVVQLVGCEARFMAEGATLAAGLGADIIDINMGCPAREVTGKRAGSALLRDADHALELIESVVGAVDIPVTLKMRTGWDEKTRNAPELARRAEAAGIKLISVHARTRAQFFTGAPDWAFVRRIKDSVSIPVVVNGDIVDGTSARAALSASGADAIMIGRAALGAPWMPARLAHALERGEDPGAPALAQQAAIASAHIEAMLAEEDSPTGLRRARKHIGWYLAASQERRPCPAAALKSWRTRLLTAESADRVLSGLREFYAEGEEAAQ